MYDVRQFKPALYVLLVLGMSAYALSAESAPIFVLGNFGILLNGWLVWHDRFTPMPRLMANIVTVGALLFTVREFLGPGATPVLVVGGFLVLLQLVKLWEQRANRDSAQLLVLSLLLMVAAAINTASLLFAILFIAYLFLSLYCCLLFHLKVEAEAAKEAIALPEEHLSPAILRQDQRYLNRSMRRLTGLVSTVAIIFAVLVFLFFPRGTGANFLGQPSFRPDQTLTGFSDQVSFDSVAKITKSPEIIAHAQIWKDGKPVTGGEIMLRGVTLDRYSRDDFHWSRTAPRDTPATGEHDRTTEFVEDQAPPAPWRTKIQLKPTGTGVLFSLAGPINFTPRRPLRFHLSSDGTLGALDPLTEEVNYEIVSTNDLNQPSYQARDGDERLLGRWSRRHRPDLIDERITAFAHKPAVCGTNAKGPLADQRKPIANYIDPLDGQIAANIERYLSSNFTYTLDLTDFSRVRGRDRIVAFLEEIKSGHCEYFAGAMTLLCQSLGIHARMVVGFKSSEFNTYTGCFVVRESDAHAWVEVFTSEGWKSFDPTSGDEGPAKRKKAGLLDNIRHVLDFLQYSYANAVVAYDSEDRNNLVQAAETRMTRAAGRGSSTLSFVTQDWLGTAAFYKAFSTVLGVLLGSMALSILGFLLYFLYEKWMLRRRARRMGMEALPASEQIRLARQLGFYDDLLRLLGHYGIDRPRQQTPLEFSGSLLFLPSDLYETVRRLTMVFYRVRFGSSELSAAQQRRLATVLSRLSTDLSTSLPRSIK